MLPTSAISPRREQALRASFTSDPLFGDELSIIARQIGRTGRVGRWNLFGQDELLMSQGCARTLVSPPGG